MSFSEAVPNDVAILYHKGLPCLNQYIVHVVRFKHHATILQHPLGLLSVVESIQF